jgi:hypothetical protein
MSLPYLYDVLDEVSGEAQSARHKFGDQFDFADAEWLAVLTEEVGEASREVLRCRFLGEDRERLMRRSLETGIPIEAADDPRARLRAELIQVAAVAGRWVRAMDERR